MVGCGRVISLPWSTIHCETSGNSDLLKPNLTITAPILPSVANAAFWLLNLSQRVISAPLITKALVQTRHQRRLVFHELSRVDLIGGSPGSLSTAALPLALPPLEKEP